MLKGYLRYRTITSQNVPSEAQITGARFQVLFNLATYPYYSITKYVKIPVFHFSEKVNKELLKIVYGTIKNDQILLYCHFNKFIKEPGNSFQSQALSQKHVENICHTAHYYLTKFHFDRT